MGTSRRENTDLITRFHNNHLISIIQTKLIQAKNFSQKTAQKIPHGWTGFWQWY